MQNTFRLKLKKKFLNSFYIIVIKFCTSLFKMLIFACLLTRNKDAFSKFFLAHKCNKLSPFKSVTFISHPFEINRLANDSSLLKSS